MVNWGERESCQLMRFIFKENDKGKYFKSTEIRTMSISFIFCQENRLKSKVSMCKPSIIIHKHKVRTTIIS